MNKEIAQNIINALMNCRRTIEDVDVFAREIEDEEFYREFCLILSRISLDLHSEAMCKILLKFPELDPYSKENRHKLKPHNHESPR